MKIIKDITNDIPKDYTGIVEYKNGDIKYFVNGECHREDGPAILWANGNRSWYLYDKKVSSKQHMYLVNLLNMGYDENVILWLLTGR